jgi:hypothetical protein
VREFRAERARQGRSPLRLGLDQPRQVARDRIQIGDEGEAGPRGDEAARIQGGLDRALKRIPRPPCANPARRKRHRRSILLAKYGA